MKKALASGLVPIICVGETLAEREAGLTEMRITTQVRGVLAGLPAGDVAKSVIAYEPVWAIGTGKTATPEQANAVHKTVRKLVGGQFGPETGDQVRILYGGSVKAENAGDLFSMTDIDGGLIGGASLTAGTFHAICMAGG